MIAEKMTRSELGAILDELGRLPADAFADRSKLQARQADLRRLLREVEIPGAEDIMKRRAGQVGSKTPEDLGHPGIVPPLRMRGGGRGFRPAHIGTCGRDDVGMDRVFRWSQALSAIQ